MILQQTKPRQRNDKVSKEVDNLDSAEEQEDDDDEFETVVDKKRGQKKQQPEKQPAEEQPQFDPRFPASDPSKVKVITVPPKSKNFKDK